MSALDVIVIALLFIGITVLGHCLSGGISDRRGFFEASGALPWWAVAASVVATLVSSVTFVSVPGDVFRSGGDLTYLQVVVGLAVGKLIIAGVVAKAYFQSTGVHSCYDWIGARLDRRVGQFSLWLGLAMNLLASSVKLLTAMIVLDVITGWGLPLCGAAICAFALLWSALAGLKTVIWTDFLLFALFSFGALLTLAILIARIDMGLLEAVRWLDDQARLTVLDLSTDPTRRFTLMAALLGTLTLSVAVAATQGTWQRVRACRSLRDVHKAYGLAAVFYVLHLVVLAIGLGLIVFYAENPMTPALAAEVAASPDRVFPTFIITELPPGLSGLFIAAIFAAAISTLDTLLVESTDLSVRHIYQRVRPNRSERHYVTASRWLLAVWVLLFLGMAILLSRLSGEGLLNLTFKLPNYLYGAVFATLILARYGVGRFPAFIIGFAVACAVVAALSQAGIAYFLWCPLSGAAMLLVVWLLSRGQSQRPEMRPDGVVHIA